MVYVTTNIDYITTHILLLMDLLLVKKLLFEIFIPMNSQSAHVIFHHELENPEINILNLKNKGDRFLTTKTNLAVTY